MCRLLELSERKMEKSDLLVAVENGDLHRVKKLLAEHTDDVPKPALFAAVQRGFLDIVKTLVEVRASEKSLRSGH